MAPIKAYRSMDGRSIFQFQFFRELDHIAVYCLLHPSLQGRDPAPHKTHLYASGKLCFVPGQEPRSQGRAEALAKQWAEYLLEYAKTGVAQH